MRERGTIQRERVDEKERRYRERVDEVSEKEREAVDEKLREGEERELF